MEMKENIMFDISKLSSQYRVWQMTDSDADDILTLCLQNTQYYQFCGKQPSKELILNDLHMTPPNTSADAKSYVGFYDGDTLVAVMDLIEGYPDEETAFIGFFMMNRHLQGKQIGTGIIQEVCRSVKGFGMKRILLGIDKENPQSTHFWKKNGFHVIREVSQEGGTILVAEKLLSINDIKDAVLYIHGKDGSAAECEHYKPLFPDCEVFGLDYQTVTPWETGAEIHAAIEKLKDEYENITLIANSIGAFFCMNAGIDGVLHKAYFISPIVDMEKLIGDMMQWANVTETELKSKGVIHTEFGEDLSWDYLCYVREHPIQWRVPTSILYGSKDNLTSLETVRAFAEQHNAALIVMEGGEHWFHTEDQMHFLDEWIRKGEEIK